MSTEFSTGVILGSMVGAGLFALLIEFTPISYHRQGIDAKVKCEQTLPRDQYCKITAIPVDKEKK